MRVLQVLPNLALGGAERMVVHLSRGIKATNFEVGVVSLYDAVEGSDLEGLLRDADIRIWYLGKKRGFDYRMIVRIRQVIKEFQPDVVHTHLSVLRYVLPACGFDSRPQVVHTVHSVAEKEVGVFGRLVHRLAFATGVVPVSIAGAVTDSIKRVYGIKVVPLIPNGIPVARYCVSRDTASAWRVREGFGASDQLIVCVARLSAVKNHSLLVEAFSRLTRKYPRAHLLLAGDGELRDAIEQQIASFGSAGKIHLLGMRTDIPELLAAADVFVLASDWEGNPLSVMEAMSAGKPVIATAVGGVVETVVDGESGLLVSPGSSDELVKALDRVLSDMEGAQVMGKRARRRAQTRFDTRHMCAAYGSLYQALVTGR